MLRFFEPEADSWWPTVSPSGPPGHFVISADPRHQDGDHARQSGVWSTMPAALASWRFPSAFGMVDIVKGRWSPAPVPATNGSQSSSPNSSSSVDSMNSFRGSGANISLQCRDANFSLESSSDPSFTLFQGGRSSSMAVNTASKNQHEAVLDWTNKRRMIDTNTNTEGAARESKKQKTGVLEEKLRDYLPPYQSTSSPSTIMTTQQIFKVAPMNKSKKMGDKVTALQQLVSPFGKTDTASVLHEAAIYIKAQQEQIKLLSDSYLESVSTVERIQVKSGGDYHHHHHHHQHKKSTSLREAGLCIVSISPIIRSLVDQEQLDGYANDGLPW